MLFILCLFVLLAGMTAVTSNRDTFSPAKFLLIFYVLFHVGALFDPPETTVLALMMAPLALIFVIAFAEASMVQFRPLPRPVVAEREAMAGIATAVWICSAPAVLSQFAMIYAFGGLEGYLNSLGSRVEDWSGFGWARILIGTLNVLNIAYLAIGLRAKRSTGWWATYGIHLAMVLVLGMLSGSRSGLLNIFAIILISFHYLRRPVPIAAAAGMVVFLSAAASILGEARNGFKVDNGEITTGLSNSSQSFSMNAFYYGVDPLKLIVEAPHLILANGSTFLSMFTNAIPRSIYPDKPDTGGVFLTKHYAGDAWMGLSNLTPTFLGEWIINFGWLAGITGFFVSYGLICMLVLRWYVRLLRDSRRPRDFIFTVDVVIYIHVMWTVVGLMPGEITNVVLGFVLTQLVPLLSLRFLLKWIVSREEQRNLARLDRALRTRGSSKGVARTLPTAP